MNSVALVAVNFGKFSASLSAIRSSTVLTDLADDERVEIERTDELTLADGGVDDALVVDAGAVVGLPAASIALCTEERLRRVLGILILEFTT